MFNVEHYAKEKGQILIVIILLVIVGVVLFSQFPKFFGGEPEEAAEEPKTAPLSPVFEEETIIAPPQTEQEEFEEETGEETKEADDSFPALLNLRPRGGLPPETREVYLEVETSEKAACRHSDASGVYYEYMQGRFSTEDGLSHRSLITTLSEGRSYIYYVRCMDEAGNSNARDSIISFWVREPEDFTPPKISNAYPQGSVLPAGTRSAMIGVSTDEPASCRYDAEIGVSYDSMDYNLSADDYERYHTATVTSLKDGRAYDFYIRCKDSAGNKNINDVLISFQVGL